MTAHLNHMGDAPLRSARRRSNSYSAGSRCKRLGKRAPSFLEGRQETGMDKNANNRGVVEVSVRNPSDIMRVCPLFHRSALP